MENTVGADLICELRLLLTGVPIQFRLENSSLWTWTGRLCEW